MHAISTMRMLYLSEVTSMVEQTLSQIKTVVAFVGEKTAMKTFSECMEKQFTLSKIEAAIKGVVTGMLQMVIFCSWAFMVWIGVVAVAAKKSNGGDTIAAVMSILFGAISLTYAAPDMQIFNQTKVVGNEIFEVIQRKSAINYESKETVLLEKISGSIDFWGVYFAYPSQVNKMVLQSFSLSIPAGKVVALVGASGCGKSTTISQVQRFYDPYKGEIFVDGHNIKDIDLKFLRTNITAVSQEPSLFVGTIKDNIKVGNMSANDNQVEDASLTTNAHCFISQFPNQHATEGTKELVVETRLTLCLIPQRQD